jgi:hypothetical protein
MEHLQHKGNQQMKITYAQYRETREALLQLFGSFGSFEHMLNNYSRQRKGDWKEMFDRQHDIAEKVSDALNEMEMLVLRSRDIDVDFEEVSS